MKNNYLEIFTNCFKWVYGEIPPYHLIDNWLKEDYDDALCIELQEWILNKPNTNNLPNINSTTILESFMYIAEIGYE